MQQQELIPHLFRTEFSRITAVLCKTFGIAHLEIAEDIAGATFQAALESWPYKGIPENPVAWLYTVAKNKAKNYLHRAHIFEQKVAGELKRKTATQEEQEIDLSEQNITDSQLRMLFVICTPIIPAEAQVGLALRILCGFGIDEIATAFLTNKETINKRLFRAKEKLRAEQIKVELPPAGEIQHRLGNVLTTLYLLYSEGYYSESQDEILREDLCYEAMRLTHLLTLNSETDTPEVNALLALMCFQSSRFAARKNERGDLVLYDEQDESLWNQELISRGAWYQNKASQGTTLSKYHLEAAIAWWYTVKTDSKEKWESILQLYNQLLQIEYSPVAALNRTYALAKANGKPEAIKEAEKLRLTDNHFYYLLLGALYTGIDNDKAMQHYEQAHRMAKTDTERNSIRKKIDRLSRA